MDERILKWLYDIKLTIEEIDGYFENQEKSFLLYSIAKILCSKGPSKEI
jgi:hypothetical protein